VFFAIEKPPYSFESTSTYYNENNWQTNANLDCTPSRHDKEDDICLVFGGLRSASSTKLAMRTTAWLGIRAGDHNNVLAFERALFLYIRQ
jgi:hypothetical protein